MQETYSFDKQNWLNNWLKSYLSLDSLFAFLLFCNAQPYFVWSQHLQNYLLYPLIFLYAVLFREKSESVNWRLLIVFVFIIIYCAIQEISIGLILNYISLPCLYIISKEKSKDIYEKLINIFSFFIGLSIIFYVINILAPGILSNYQIPPINPKKDYNYIVYPFFVIPNTFAEFRFHGLFDEAGANGTISALFLYIEGYNLRKKRNIVLLINGILSLSFFFILCSLAYFIISKIRKVSENFRIILIAILGVVLFYNYTKDDEVIKFFVWDRISLSDEGKVSGDNRSDKYFEANYNDFLASSDVLFGRGVGSGAKAAEDSSSYKLLVYDYGAIWFVLFVFFWGAHIYKENGGVNLKLFIMFFFFFSMIYQRPGILIPFYCFTFINLFPYKKEEEEEERENELFQNNEQINSYA